MTLCDYISSPRRVPVFRGRLQCLAVATWSCVRGLPRRCFHSGAATNRAQGGEINVVCRRLSCVFCRFMLQWTLDVGWISWLTFKQKTKKLHLRIYRPWQELSMFWWMSQLAGGEQIKDCWVALPNILVSVEILFQNYFKIKNYWVCSRKNPSLGERSGIPCGLCLRTGLRDILTKKFF